jgi:prepilin-type N-terminal cleavage/methylation domain-containing protein
MPVHRKQHGFTLIELMVTVGVVFVTLLIALPSFFAMRQRAALRGAAEETLTMWQQTRMEAAKRNQMVKFGVSGSGGAFCLGAATTTNASDDVPCDCTGVDTGPGKVCDVGTFPSNTKEWRGVSLQGATLGQNTGVAVMDSKRSALTDSADAGGITFNGPPGRNAYSITLRVDQFGRAFICEPSSATNKMPDFSTRQCNL